ncbi:ATPase, T2SS/T4P/T4SS family [Desulforamulus putei]|uniref:AAA family ATPase n=1 Tax=Desulforamulus putei TaxID=74701 RepID=UPI002FDEDBE1
MIGNIVIVGPAASGKSTVLANLVKATVLKNNKIIMVTDYKNDAQKYIDTEYNCLYPRRFTEHGKVNLLYLALENKPDILVIDEIRTPDEALAVYKILIEGRPKVWLTVHGQGIRKEILDHFLKLLKLPRKDYKVLLEFFSGIIVLKKKKIGSSSGRLLNLSREYFFTDYTRYCF